MSHHKKLTKSKIIKAALMLVNKQGLEALSMRKLASKLRVEAASLYNHVKGKQQLLDWLQAECYLCMAPAANSETWQDYISRLAHHVRDGLLAMPNMVPLFATRPTITMESLDQLEQTLAVLLKVGFTLRQGVLIFRNLHVFIFGHLLAEVGRVPGEKRPHEDPELSNIDFEKFPLLQQSFQQKSGAQFEDGFNMGLTNFVDGLEKMLIKRGV